jgi:hypothetical protein
MAGESVAASRTIHLLLSLWKAYLDPMTDDPADALPEAVLEEAANDPGFNLDVPGATRERLLTPAARRALEEAAERRVAAAAELATEHGGPRGPEPTRYGDWEKKGLAVDF